MQVSPGRRGVWIEIPVAPVQSRWAGAVQWCTVVTHTPLHWRRGGRSWQGGEGETSTCTRRFCFSSVEGEGGRGALVLHPRAPLTARGMRFYPRGILSGVPHGDGARRIGMGGCEELHPPPRRPGRGSRDAAGARRIRARAGQRLRGARELAIGTPPPDDGNSAQRQALPALAHPLRTGSRAGSHRPTRARSAPHRPAPPIPLVGTGVRRAVLGAVELSQRSRRPSSLWSARKT